MKNFLKMLPDRQTRSHLNPIALRTAKTLHIILAVLNAINSAVIQVKCY